MKTKRAMQDYECYLCKSKIQKGSQYARKTVTIGKTTIHPDGQNAPDWAWEPYKEQMPICESCANPTVTP